MDAIHDYRREEADVSKREMFQRWQHAYNRRRGTATREGKQRDHESSSTVGYICKCCGRCFATPERLGQHMGVR